MMRIIIRLDSSSYAAERQARHLADDIWALDRAGGVDCVIVEFADGRAFCVVGDPPAGEQARPSAFMLAQQIKARSETGCNTAGDGLELALAVLRERK